MNIYICTFLNLNQSNSIITGDFNYNLFNIQYHEDTGNYYNIMTSNSFRTIITKPTRITDNSSTLIDHIWINDMSTDHVKSKIILSDITDHLPTAYVKCNQGPPSGYSKIFYRPLTDENKINFKSKVEEMSDILSICTKRNDLNANEKAVDYFTHLGKLYNDCFPLKCKKMHNKTLNKPWITQDLQKLIKRKNRLYGRKLKSKSPENLEKYNQCKRDLNKKLYISKKQYLSDKLLNTSRNLKLKWDAIRLVINRQKKQSTYCPIDNKLLGTHYSSVAEKLNSKLKNINENVV